jgi:cysteine desulfurase / selenocysteine lyase
MIYMDNAATSWPKAPGTADAIAETILHPWGNPGRSSHSAGISSDRLLFELRELLAEHFAVSDSAHILFTSGTTESINLVLNGFLRQGDKILTSSMEHNAVMRPLRYLEKERNIRIIRFPSDIRTGFPDLAALEKLIKEEHPSLLVTTAASNVNGIVFPVEEICRLAAKEGIPVCVDAAQAAGERDLYPEKWGMDFLSFSGHKGMLGPAGTGGLYIKDPDRLPPFKRGGTGSRSSEELQPDFLPDKFESGTPNIPGLAGWHHSLIYLKKTKGTESIDALYETFLHKLRSLQSLKIIGHPEEAAGLPYTPVLSLVPLKRSLSDLTRILNENGIAVRTGLHCAPGAHRTLGTLKGGGTIRFSPGRFNTSHEISTVYHILKEQT